MPEDQTESEPESEESEDKPGVSSAEYRFKYLSTILAIFVGVWFPLWVTASSIQGWGEAIDLGGAMTSVLTAGRLTAVAYSFGTDTFKAVYEVVYGKG